jgi:16S rRNA (cytosine967-C5)-methyltransferase
MGAARLVEFVLDRRLSLEAAMEETQSFARLEGRDRAFAAAVALATLRHLGQIDAILRSLMERPIADASTWPWAILRTGVAQLLTGLAPAHAVVSRAVAVARVHRSASGLAPLMNAVLRKAATVELASLDPADALPLVWRRRWEAAYGTAAVQVLARVAQQPAALDLSAGVTAPAVLAVDGARRLPTGSIRLSDADVRATDLPGWETGEIWVQDAAAALPARLLRVRPGDRVLDLCAAPGGKTLQLAAAGAEVTAVDADAARMQRLRDNLARTGLTADVFVGDARRAQPDRLFDAVLLDAPCSATGTIRRHPETVWIKTPQDIARLAALQGELMAAAARQLKPGGRLVYAVCSLEPEEAGSGQAAAAAAGLVADPVLPDELPGLEAALLPDGSVRILPGLWEAHGGLDGFFMARFRRPG